MSDYKEPPEEPMNGIDLLIGFILGMEILIIIYAIFAMGD